MSDSIERPELITMELWYYDDRYLEKSIAYADVDGVSPTITDHLSLRTYEITAGEGAFSSDGIVAHVRQGCKIEILPGTPFSYAGRMSLLSTCEQATIPEFVTFDNQKLGRQERKRLRERDRRIACRELTEAFMEKYMPSVDALLRFTVEPEKKRAP